VGACCTLDGTCSQLSEPACRGANGVYGGIGVACAAANCPTAYNYLGNAVPIPDAVNGTTCGAEAFAEMTVTDSFTLGSADASLFITHTFQGDVKVWLEHTTTNHRVQIINQPPAGQGTYGTGITPNADNYGQSTASTGLMRLIDSASSRYITPPAPAAGIPGVTGEWIPENPLAAFAGENSAGTWRLVAQDCGPGDIGNIEYWVLSLRRPGVTCYPNCDHSTQNPFLNVQDFSCFLTKYAAGDSYANCDNSTQQPVLNVQDFSCFLTKYAAGCSAP